jgi:hypothetical protein
MSFVTMITMITMIPSSVKLAMAADVSVVRLDGSSVSGKWAGSESGDIVRLIGADGQLSIPVDGMISLSVIGNTTLPLADDSSQLVYLADGSRLKAGIREIRDDALVMDCPYGEGLSLDLSMLAAIRLTPDETSQASSELLAKWLERREPGKDILITRVSADAEAKALKGRLVELTAEGGTFEFGNRLRKFSFDKAYAVVFAAGTAERVAPPVKIAMRGGSLLAGSLGPATDETISVVTSWKSPIALPIADVVSWEVRSDRIVYLSDLVPVKQEIQGIIHQDWPVRMDQSASAGPLRLGGQTFAKGIGCHSYSEITFKLDEPFTKLAARIGIDDHVRPRGSVQFRIVGDDRVLYDSGELSGRDDPLDISVDVNGVEWLKLIVDIGESLDLSDHADWAAIRLIRPASGNNHTSEGRT